MSTFKLENPRPRSALPPIRVRSPEHTPSTTSPTTTTTTTTTLLYDLPQSTSRSPPTQTTESLLYSPPSPKSPLYANPVTPRQSQRPLQSPPPRSRNNAPAQTQRQELDQFATFCRAFYFEQNESAGQLMMQTLEALDSSQRATFSRLQASIRSSYHAHMAKRRRTEFRAHLSSTHPGGSLSPSSRANPFGHAAKKERYDRFSIFLRTWCTIGMPGPKPFFQGVWAVLRLQVLPTGLGGAGAQRIEWEFDDAVFQESAGKEFMMEAVDILKGVLGFEDYSSPRSPRSSCHSEEPPITGPSVQSPVTRPRSPSDPFLDTPALSRYVGTSSAQTLDGNFRIISETRDEFPADNKNEFQSFRSSKRDTFTPNQVLTTPTGDQPYMRIWITPDLDNPELHSLLSLFPDFISRHSLPRFPLIQSRTRRRSGPDLEARLDTRGDRKEVSCGTGRIWIGERMRRDGYEGRWWRKFSDWLRRLLC